MSLVGGPKMQGSALSPVFTCAGFKIDVSTLYQLWLLQRRVITQLVIVQLLWLLALHLAVNGQILEWSGHFDSAGCGTAA